MHVVALAVAVAVAVVAVVRMMMFVRYVAVIDVEEEEDTNREELLRKDLDYSRIQDVVGNYNCIQEAGGKDKVTYYWVDVVSFVVVVVMIVTIEDYYID